MSRISLINCLLAWLVAGWVSCGLAAHAQSDQLNQDFVPPDVTVPTNSSPYTVPVNPGGFGSYQPGATGADASPGGSPAANSAASPVTGTANGPSTSPNTSPGIVTTSEQDPLATIATMKGTIVIHLFRKYAPNTVANFIELCNKGFYDGLTFHRVEPGFVIQGGDPNGNGSGLYIDPATNTPRFLNLEISPHLRHNAPGVVAMARFGKNPNSASCQFYITLAPQPKLDNQYSIFGGVVSGMEVVNRIQKGDKILSIKVQEQ